MDPHDYGNPHGPESQALGPVSAWVQQGIVHIPARLLASVLSFKKFSMLQFFVSVFRKMWAGFGITINREFSEVEFALNLHALVKIGRDTS